MQEFDEVITLEDIGDGQIRGNDVLLRASFDTFDQHGNIKDSLRIEESESTIRMLKHKGARRIIILTYAGRPEKTPSKEPKVGENAKYNGVLYDRRMSLRPIADFLYGMFKEKIHFISALKEDGTFMENAAGYAAHAKEYMGKKTREGDIVLLDNLRFWEGENKGNEPVGQEFAKLIASLGTVYVQDGFAQAHRGDNATVGEITKHTKLNVLGLQFKKELTYLKGIFDNLKNENRKPFVFIVAGRKIETKPGIVSKIDIASSLMQNMREQDKILVGGAMAYPFLVAKRYLRFVKQGVETLRESVKGRMIKNIVGDSYLDWDQIYEQVMVAGKMLIEAEKKGVEVKLPVDHGVFTIGSKMAEVFYVENIADGMVAGDIGPKTVADWSNALHGAHTIVLAGPVGWYENELFTSGCMGIVKAIANETEKNGTISIGAGGDTSEMIRSFGYGRKFSLVSIGGGATLEFLQHGTLPALAFLDKKAAIKIR